MIVTQTDRLILRQLEAADHAAMCRILCDGTNMRFFPKPFTPEEVAAAIERNQQRYVRHGFGIWAVIVRETGEFAGDCGITLQPVEEALEHEVGYHFARPAQGHGYATEAARACFALGFSRFGLERMISLIRPENVGSVRVALRNGLTPERLILRAGLPHLVYATSRLDWLAAPSS